MSIFIDYKDYKDEPHWDIWTDREWTVSGNERYITDMNGLLLNGN